MMKGICILIITIIFGINTYAQDVTYKHYTTDDGLASNKVYGVMQDRNGYIWTYTDNGVSRFDGYTFKNYNLKNGLGSNDIWLMHEGSRGHLYCYSYSNKFSYIKDYKAFHKQFSSSARSGGVLVEDSNKLYTVGQASYYQFIMSLDNQPTDITDQINLKTLQNKIALKYPTGHLNARNFFVYNKSLVYILDKDADTLNSFPIKEKELIQLLNTYEYGRNNTQYVRSPFLGRKENYFTMGSYFFRIRERGYDYFNFSNYLVQNKNGRSITAHKSGNDLVLVDGVGHCLKLDSKLKQIDYYDYSWLNNNHPDSRAFIDRSGNVWVNTLSNGLYFISNKKRQVHTLALASMGEQQVPSFIKKHQQAVYIGSTSGAVFKWNGLKLKRIFQGDAKAVNDYVYYRNQLLFGQMGLWNEKDASLKAYRPSELNYDVDGGVHNLAKWGVVLALEEKNAQSFFMAVTPFVAQVIYGQNRIKAIADVRAYDLAYLKDKGLFIASSTGLKYWGERTKKIDSIKPKELNVQLNKLKIVGVNLLIGTDGIGLFSYNTQSEKLVSLSAALGERIRDIYPMPDGSAFVASDKGVELIDYEQNKLLFTLDKTNLLPSNNVTALGLKGDTLLVGSDKGLSFVPMDLLKSEHNPIPFALNKVLLDNAEIDQAQLLNLKPSEKNLQFEFSSLNYAAMPYETYYYRLNKNQKWRSTNRNRLNFDELASGTYELEIYAKGNRENILAIPITIATPFFKSAWFYALLALLAIALSYYLFRRRENRMKVLTQKENEINKRIAELELSALQSQMNPHFVFNSLGSIQYFQRENIELADEYLGKFARLMRLFLESSKKQYTTIEDELLLLELYLDMEKIRLGDKLSFQIALTEDIDPTVDEIPSMIVQPFVENAINHGIFHKESPGHIRINFSWHDEQSIQVVIEDDGIGREAAEAIKAKSLKTHTSRAMQIVQEKLDVLQASNNFKFGFEIEDLFNDKNEACGTRATLLLPS